MVTVRRGILVEFPIILGFQLAMAWTIDILGVL